jgi:hypothetical protein
MFVLGQATKIFILRACSPASITSPRFQGSGNFFLSISQLGTGEVVVALNAGVMRRFKRVVALPDPKDIEFPQPQQHFPLTRAHVQ